MGQVSLRPAPATEQKQEVMCDPRFRDSLQQMFIVRRGSGREVAAVAALVVYNCSKILFHR